MFGLSGGRWIVLGCMYCAVTITLTVASSLELLASSAGTMWLHAVSYWEKKRA